MKKIWCRHIKWAKLIYSSDRWLYKGQTGSIFVPDNWEQCPNKECKIKRPKTTTKRKRK